MKKHTSNPRMALIVSIALLVPSALVGCATSPKKDLKQVGEKQSLRTDRIEARLKKAGQEIEALKERNAVLQRRLELERRRAENPNTNPDSTEALRAFDAGTTLDVPIDNRIDVGQANASSRVNASHRRDRADRMMARTVLSSLKAGKESEAERTANLLEKSYPDSELVAETRFQQGMHAFRKKDFAAADRYFA
ncbi:MAG: hypothetical protein RBT63_09255, partial [Bdellovibrionales bacterium]|nr:hypothetical protein [Bdellovibrionales bacterium]